MTRDGWDRMAEWRDERTGEEGDLWHRAIILPAVYHVVGSVRGLRVLDLGCGVGMLARRFAKQGARSVVGIDRSGPTIERARARERRDPTGTRFVRCDAGNLRALPSGSFDLVVANMSLMDIEEAERAVGEVGRVLRPHGRFVFSISHPCFDTDLRSMWVVERAVQPNGRFVSTVFRKVSGYRQEVRQSVPWHISERRSVRTFSYHRTLATYVRYLRSAGLSVVRIEEPSPLPEALEQSPQGPFIAEIPLHLVVEALRTPKLGSPRPASRTSADSPAAARRRSGSSRRTRGSGSRHPGSTPGS